MAQVNVLEAKTSLSALLRALESGEEKEFVIARRNVPVARLTAYGNAGGDASHRIGVARGRKLVADGYDFDAPDPDIEALFGMA